MIAEDHFTLYGGFTLPRSSPLADPHNYYLFCISLLILHGTYHALAHTIFAGDDKDKLKARSWILTTLASLVMSAASLPYLWDLFAHGYDFLRVKPRLQTVADPLAIFFIAYLIS